MNTRNPPSEEITDEVIELYINKLHQWEVENADDNSVLGLAHQTPFTLEHILLFHYDAAIMEKILSHPKFQPLFHKYLYTGKIAEYSTDGKTVNTDMHCYFIRDLSAFIACPDTTIEEARNLLRLLHKYQYPLVPWEYRPFSLYFNSRSYYIDTYEKTYGQFYLRPEWGKFLMQEGYFSVNRHIPYSLKYLEFFVAFHLGYLLSECDINPNCDKFKAIFDSAAELLNMFKESKTEYVSDLSYFGIPFGVVL